LSFEADYHELVETQSPERPSGIEMRLKNLERRKEHVQKNDWRNTASTMSEEQKFLSLRKLILQEVMLCCTVTA
jgi:hypothetical protein